jgi:hypothetical protein
MKAASGRAMRGAMVFFLVKDAFDGRVLCSKDPMGSEPALRRLREGGKLFFSRIPSPHCKRQKNSGARRCPPSPPPYIAHQRRWKTLKEAIEDVKIYHHMRKTERESMRRVQRKVAFTRFPAFARGRGVRRGKCAWNVFGIAIVGSLLDRRLDKNEGGDSWGGKRAILGPHRLCLLDRIEHNCIKKEASFI